MTPRAPSKERVEVLKKVLCCVNEREQWFSFEEFKDIFAILDEHGTIQPLVDMADDLTERNMKLEAQLEKQRPLVEAVLKPCENRITYMVRIQDEVKAYRERSPK